MSVEAEMNSSQWAERRAPRQAAERRERAVVLDVDRRPVAEPTAPVEITVGVQERV